MHCTPEGEKQNRWQANPEWTLPDCDEFGYIAQWFSQLRFDYDYVQIKAWSDLTGFEPTPKEVDLLMSMSNTYKNGLIKYRSKGYDHYPPYKDPEAIAAAQDRALSSLFGD